MPTICQFSGITIAMYLREKEHEPPHIHALFQNASVPFLIATGEPMEKPIPPKVVKLVREFILEYQDELLLMWETGQYKKLPPCHRR